MEPQTGNMLPTWVMALATVVAAGATIVYATISFLDNRARKQAEAGAIEAVDRRLGAIAFTLSRQIGAWVTAEWANRGAAQWVDYVLRGAAQAEARLTEIILEAPHASSSIAACALEAASHYYDAFDAFNEVRWLLEQGRQADAEKSRPGVAMTLRAARAVLDRMALRELRQPRVVGELEAMRPALQASGSGEAPPPEETKAE